MTKERCDLCFLEQVIALHSHMTIGNTDTCLASARLGKNSQFEVRIPVVVFVCL